MPKYDIEDKPDSNGVYTNGIDSNLSKFNSTTSNGILPNDEAPGYSPKPSESDTSEKEEKRKLVGTLEVFRYASGNDRCLFLTGILMAVLEGACQPLMIIVFGNMTNTFIDNQWLMDELNYWAPRLQEVCYNLTGGASWCDNITADNMANNPSYLEHLLYKLNMSDTYDEIQQRMVSDFSEEIARFCSYYAILGTAVIILAYFQMLCGNTAAYHTSQRIRSVLFRSVLGQDISWFDTQEVGQLNTRLSDDVQKIEDGIGEKLSLFFQWFSTFIFGFVVGFTHGWQLTLVILCVTPLLAGAGFTLSRLGTMFTSAELAAYARAGAVAEEVIGGIRTVTAFGGQNKELQRYTSNLNDARKVGVRKGTSNGSAMGVINLIMYCGVALAFWYGASLVQDHIMTAGDLIIVLFGVIIGSFALGNATPNAQEFANARGAAYMIFEIIDQLPQIDCFSENGEKLAEVKGNIEFKDVNFNYPSRPDVNVLQGVNFSAKVGRTVALVGSSGCGKSTTVQLIQRFYDTCSGQVLIDGHDVRELNVRWLRQQIGVVSQEPVLFATSIEENVRYGRDGVSDEQIQAACVMANAHDFIKKLPKQYKTLVGERGAQLSGGQKQRIAIARALVRDPKILLLDEATSALDTESEATVQAALDKARQGRTTLVIAHRLSTVRTADLIVGVDDGKVMEIGTHDELMEHKGIYHTLVKNQETHFHGGDKKGDPEYNTNEDDDDALILPTKPGLGMNISVTDSKSRNRASSVSSHTSSQPDVEEELPIPPFSRILKLSRPEAVPITFGCVFAVCAGLVQPSFAIIFANMLGVFASIDESSMQQEIDKYSVLFVIIGAFAAITNLGMASLLSWSGEALTMRLRHLSFKSLIRQEISFYDDPFHGTGAMCSRLATDASKVQGATGIRLSTFCMNISSIGFGLIIGFVFSWQLTLLVLAFAPFIMAAGMIRMRVFRGTTKEGAGDPFEAAGKVAVEAIGNIRTVATLTQENKFHEDYVNATEAPYRANLKNAHIHGLAYGFSQGIIYYCYAACFYLGQYLVLYQGLAFQNMFKVLMAVMFGAMAAGQASSFAPDYGKAKVAAAKIFDLIDKEPSIDSFSEEGKVLKRSDVSGAVEFRQVDFSYPLRPNVPVLTNLSLVARPGRRVALVGSSGCGKSTTVQLLERFYDPLRGQVFVDDNDIRTCHIQSLRAQMGIVSQEPVLFATSIRENIAYGDNSRQVTMEEIIRASREANIHCFIELLPKGYDTPVGDKGAQLSGGQKQRIAIARALVRDPKILLLDEATSALDTESEKVVQEALDRAQEGRTCLVIAHRLSTIRNADSIVVISNGRVAEVGTHDELMQQRGHYFRFNHVQDKNDTAL